MRRSSRRFLSFVSGVGLYLAALTLGQYLGPVGVPTEWTSAFGHRGSTEVMVAEAMILALPVFLVSLLWAWLTVRPWGGARNPHTAWCVGGAIIAAVGCLLIGVMMFSLNPPGYEVPVSYLLLRVTQAPLWGVQNSLAAFAGLVVAVFAIRRYMRLHPVVRTRRSSGIRPATVLGPVAAGATR